MRRTSLILIAGIILALVGCPGPAADRARSAHMGPLACCTTGSVAARHQAVARTAAKLVGAKAIRFRGRTIRYDCVGVTRAIYLAHGIDLFQGVRHDTKANGTRLVYNHVRKYGRIHRGPTVRPGDLVFFDNTWDYNGDGKINDPLTHIGVVERVEPNGTVVFISRVSRAIERYRMNLAKPGLHRSRDGRLLNDFMRRKRRSDPDNTHYMTGELFAAFGTRIASP